jgi:hypothetical protein
MKKSTSLKKQHLKKKKELEKFEIKEEKKQKKQYLKKKKDFLKKLKQYLINAIRECEPWLEVDIYGFDSENYYWTFIEEIEKFLKDSPVFNDFIFEIKRPYSIAIIRITWRLKDDQIQTS